MKISSNFDSGNIELVQIEHADDIQLKIRKDVESDHCQWFYFRLVGNQGIPTTLKIINAGETSYPEAWPNYKVCASYDRVRWFRIPTTYKNGVLSFSVEPDYNSMYFAYFAPFSYEQHLDMINMAQSSELCVADTLGKTVLGRDIDFLTIGEPSQYKRKIWIIARQHPGETMASWFMNGLISRLLDTDDAVSRRLLEKAVFYLVPNMNIDGSIAGNLRTNIAGLDLNREWAGPSPASSPEVYNVLVKMTEVGVDMMLDIHGDETIPYNFVSRNEGIPSYTERLKNLEERFIEAWMTTSPDFQNQHGYPKKAPGTANMSIGAKAIGEKFDCLSLTVEMPFKDNDNLPDYHYGWSPDRSEKFGESVLQPILTVLPYLRD